jgi:hypothetical protein
MKMIAFAPCQAAAVSACTSTSLALRYARVVATSIGRVRATA